MILEALHPGKSAAVGGRMVDNLPAEDLLPWIACKVAKLNRSFDSTHRTYGQLIDVLGGRPLNLPLQETLAIRDVLIMGGVVGNPRLVTYAIEAGCFASSQNQQLNQEELEAVLSEVDFPKMRELVAAVKVYVPERPLGERYVAFGEIIAAAT